MDLCNERLIGASAAMRHVLGEIASAAGRAAHVLLSGEPGTGRQLVARAIHAQSRFRGGPFVAVDCAKSSPQDLEAQLFATTVTYAGAERRGLERVKRPARLLESRGGTLFLQNIVDLPTRLQSRLVRVLRDGEVHVMDDTGPVELDLRVIASADPSFDAAVREGDLLPDLHKRLSGVRLDLPPLRDRREDIPELADYFVSQACERARQARKQISASAKSLLAALPWHGNGSELRRVLESLVPRVSAATIELDDVLAVVKLDGQVSWLAGGGGSLREARARFETEYIVSVMAQHHGRIPDAARALGIQRSNLYRKLRNLKLQTKPRPQP